MSFFRRLKLPPVPAIQAGEKPFLPARAGRDIEDYFRKLRDALAAWDPDASPVVVGASVGGALTLGDSATIEATSTAGGVTFDIVDGSVTDAKLSPMAANTVKGNATAATATPADISVGTNTVLGRVAGNIVAASLVTGQVADDAITYAKLQNVSAAARVLGRGGAAGAGNAEELTLALGLSLATTVLSMIPVVLRPAQVTGNQNDYSPGTFGPDRTTIFVSTDASRNFTGLLATGIADGVTLRWINDGTQNEVLQHANGGSTAANQFICPGAVDLTVAAGTWADIVRDATAARWRVRAL